MIIKLWLKQKVGNFLTRWVTVSFSRRTLLHGVRETCQEVVMTFLTHYPLLWLHGLLRQTTHYHDSETFGIWATRVTGNPLGAAHVALMGKVKLKLSLYLSKHQLHAFSISALDGGEWSASRPSHFTPGKEPPVPNGSEAGWAPEPVWTRWRRKKSHHCTFRELNPGRPARSLVSTLTKLSRLLCGYGGKQKCIQYFGGEVSQEDIKGREKETELVQHTVRFMDFKNVGGV
jgi:hypothetical protein